MGIDPSTVTVAVEADATDADEARLYDGLAEYNRPYLGDIQHRHLRILARDGEGAIVGGLIGDLYYDWLYVSILWLAEPVRKFGIGSRLLATAEAEARAAGCHGAHLDTFDFQARSFYERRGYVVHGELGPYGAPPGHIRYYLKKSLIEGQP
jgi:GNAT superfamily N-acetyltransferase